MKNQSGFIKLILLIVIVVFILSYFGINLRSVADSDVGKDNFSLLKDIALKVWDFVLYVWDRFLATPVLFIWNELVLKYIWPIITNSLDKLKSM